VLRKTCKGIDLQLSLAEPDRPRLGDADSGAHDTDLDVSQIGRVEAVASKGPCLTPQREGLCYGTAATLTLVTVGVLLIIGF
jgi:hypothetical protein